VSRDRSSVNRNHFCLDVSDEMPKDAQVVAHVERHVREALESLARDDGRKLSAYVERLLISHLEKKRRLPVRKAASTRSRPY
jgi:hypothetical protein